MAKLSPLTAAVQLNLKEWNAGIKQMNRDSKALGEALKPTQKLMENFGKPMVAAGLIIGGTLVALAKKAADYGDEMLEASQKTGIQTKQLAALRLVAEQSGSSFEGITTGVTKLSKTLVEASTKGGEAAKVFQVLGINIKDSSGNLRQASDILPEIADRFARMKDGTEKTALAIKLFGKAGADLIPTLNQGADGFRRASEMVEKYNVDIGYAGNKLGDKFNDSLKETNLAVQGLANQVGKALLPAMIEGVALINNMIAGLSSWAKEHPGLTRGIAATAAALTGAGGLLLGLSAILVVLPKINQSLLLLKATVTATNPWILALTAVVVGLTAAFAAFPEIRGPVLDTLKVIYQAVAGVVGTLTNLLNGLYAQFMAPADPTAGWNVWKNIIKNVSEDVADAGVRFDKFVGSVKEVGKAFDMKSMAGDAKELATELAGIDLDGLGKDAKDAANQIETMWKSLKRENSEVDALNAVLARAYNAHLSIENVMDKLGPTIKDVTEDFIASNQELPEFIAYYEALREETVGLTQATEDWHNKIQATMDKFNALAREAELEALNPIDITRDPDTQKRIDEMAALGNRMRGVTDSLQAQQQEVAVTAQKMIELSKAGASAEQIEAMLGTTAENLSKRMKDLGGPIDSVTKKALDQMAAAKKLRDSWGDTFGAISDRLVDMVVDFDFSFKRLADIGKSTAKDLLRSFLDGFLSPFKSKLAEWGRGAADAISGVLFGRGGGGPSNQGNTPILASILGGGGLLGGLFGGGNKGPMSELPGAEFGGAGLFGGMSQQLSGLAASLNPVSMGFNIANGAVDLYNKTFGRIGAGRKSANEIVKSQNAFVNTTLGDILADTSLSATNKFKQVTNAWDSFQAQLRAFGATGDKNTITSNQAFATVSPLVSKIQSDLIKQGANQDAGAGGGNTYTFGDIVWNVTINDADNPESILDMIKRNVAGVTEEIVRQVQLKEGAVVSR